MAIGHTKAAAGDMFSSDTALTISGNASTISDEPDPDCLLVHTHEPYMYTAIGAVQLNL